MKTIIAGLLIVGLLSLAAGEMPADMTAAHFAALKDYFAQRVSSLEGQLEREVKTREDWLNKKDEYRRELAEMLGLEPLPPRTELNATKTGEFEYDGIVVEKLHYQSMPGLYVTANLYRPKTVTAPLPAILYGCGHADKQKDGVSYGNKAGYEHHGVWYAKHGFVCLVYDTVQLGEIRGEHHGTYDKGRFWWWSRGYTPAGVEAWSGIRGLDYLETRPEVDKTRFGVAGRSGGGAYSWYVAALDERVKCAAPTAGITSLRNHVVDGCVEGHCDCMYFVNTYRWDYDKLAALVAPRPLCIGNTDKDTIFPLDGVMKIYNSTRRIYKLLDAEKNIGLQIAEGPHADPQTLNDGEFHWMMRFLQNAAQLSTLDAPAVHGIEMEKLRVFGELPKDERNTRIDESFVPRATNALPATKEDWVQARTGWMKDLREKCFAAWPAKMPVSRVSYGSSIGLQGVMLDRVHIAAGEDGYAMLWMLRRKPFDEANPDRVEVHVLDDADWKKFAPPPGREEPRVPADAMERLMKGERLALVFFCPRGVGDHSWDSPAPAGDDPKAAAKAQKARTMNLRRFYLLGETLAGQQVLDIRLVIRAVRTIDQLDKAKIELYASRTQAANALFASLFESRIPYLELDELPHSLMPVAAAGSPVTGNEPVYLNALKYLDVPQALAMAAERSKVSLDDKDAAAWKWPLDAAAKFGFETDTTGIKLAK